ncbi:DNA repair-scaffolding protein isoform X1 [Sinocyclocheilus rhinocerous]|uniref:DNA repair-scaffolding protein isoform X1 n=1 Tax=Sinocyclocheilus rhinocerous TaxID=307959 RepID=UPI0007B8A023|nr:PREDICTED: DNA repair-scaffolding protein-like isoform X1 [Sinocyclocheilus rhinocerous]
MGKRKRNLDMRCVLFPDDVKDTFKKAGKASARTSTPATKSWERCGDSFLDTSVIQKLQTSEKSRNARKVALTSVTGNGDAGTDEPVHIAWSSSEEEESDGDSHPPPRLTVTQAPQLPRAHKQHPVDSCRSLRMFSTGVETDDLPFIDSDSEIEEENSASKEHIDFLNPVVSPNQISDYSSYDDNDEDPEESRADAAESSRQSVSEWVRSAQAILQTPQKCPKSIKTPEDSSKKRRRFERGGLAERLNRLHSRQKSAISFWRHQCNSTTSAAERPGVLMLRILGVREECGMQAAVCDRLPEGEKCVALFSKDTAAQLQPAPGDVVHIYPPWQNLVVEGERYPIILNTHFSQKACEETKPDNAGGPRAAVAVEKCRPPPLTWSLWRSGTSQVSTETSIPCKQVGELNRSGVRKSLLDAVEDCGSSGSQSGPVEVVVQRVYCIPITQSLHRTSLQHRALDKPPPESAPPQHIGRLCALVQDSYGMFGEVLLHCVSTESEIQQNSEQLEGHVCLLQALRVVQRLTRDKCSPLFSMIDSLWPPPVDPKSHDDLLQSPRDRVPPPCFCYRLSVQLGHMVPLSGQTESPLYRSPVLQTLREILQDESSRCRCSFRATVVHKQLLSSDAGEREMLLFVTDPSLQREPNTDGNRRTVAVCLSPSCLIQSSVTQALDALQTQPVLMFRDAVKENAQIFCWEQTVIQLEPEDSSFSIPRPIILDHLGPETLPYSLCTVTGVVVAVDESTAFSWPTCSCCESCSLETREHQKGFLCLACGAVMDEPTTKMELEVFLSCSSLSHCTVKIKLQQKTIKSLLNSSWTEGYSVENVLGSEIGPLSVFVHVVNRSHTVWMGLEECDLH